MIIMIISKYRMLMIMLKSITFIITININIIIKKQNMVSEIIHVVIITQYNAIFVPKWRVLYSKSMENVHYLL